MSDGTHTANLHFAGNYTAQNFKFVSDGGSGTTVYDPPAPSGVSTLDGHGFMLDGDLHEAVTAQAPAVKALLGGFTGGGAEAAPENEPALGGFDILVRSLLTQHDFHASAVPISGASSPRTKRVLHAVTEKERAAKPLYLDWRRREQQIGRTTGRAFEKHSPEVHDSAKPS